MDPRRIDGPPRLAERVLRASLPHGPRGLGMLGDLREDYYARVAAGRGSRWWFWREAILLSLRYMNITTDIRLAVRGLARDFSTTAIIVLTLGVALGASTIGFTFADLAVLRGLPIVDPGNVVTIYSVDPRRTEGRSNLSPAHYRDLRDQITTLAPLAAFQSGRATLVDRGIPTSLDVTRVSTALFEVMGIGAAVGRTFQPGDDQPGRLAVVLAHHYWRRVYDGSEAVLGTSLLINGRTYTVVGVVSPDMEFGTLATANLWLPLEITAASTRTDRPVTVMGRLKPGVSFEAARAEVTAISSRLALDYPENEREWRATAYRLTEVAFGRGFWVIITLFILAVALILVIACANAASLVLARAVSRRRETALRTALGAGRLRLLRQALVEGVVLSGLSVAFAWPMAMSALRLIKSVDSEPAIQQLALDGHEFGFIALLALLTPVLFSVLPTLSAIRLDVRSTLQSGGARAGTTGRGRSVLVAVQLALAVMLLTTGGLAVRTGVNLSSIDYGLRTSDALTFAMDLDTAESPIADEHQFLDTARAALATIPGVTAVHVFQTFPVLASERVVTVGVDGRAPAPNEVKPWAVINAADAGALAAVGVPLVAGRWIAEHEERRRAPVAVVGETTARMYFDSPQLALGKRLTVGEEPSWGAFEIVGVAGDVLVNDVERGKVPRIWTALRGARRLNFVVSTAGRQADLAAGVRREMAAVAPAIPLEQLESMEHAFTRFQASNQVVIGIFAGFSLLALVLAATGLYGLITYTVGQRRSEFGTRFALGARPRDVLLLVVAQVGRLIAIGLALGLAGGLAGGFGMRSVLYGVSATDPVTIAAVIGVMAAAALAASAGPALRAARVNLADALRAE